jgi:hypothetical protein
MHIGKTRGISAIIVNQGECMNGKKSKVTYPEFGNNQIRRGAAAKRIFREAVVRPPPSYVAATTREIDYPREIPSK